MSKEEIFNCSKCQLVYVLPSKCDHYQDLAQETIKAKDAEIEIHWEVRNKQHKAIAEARELIDTAYDIMDDNEVFQQEARAWLEVNK